MYAELHCLTNFTFLRGASRAEELVERATQLGYAALAITDECSVAGMVRAGLGITEGTDAVAVMVSEETGGVSLAADGEIYSQLDDARLRELLKGLLGPRSNGAREGGTA